MKASITAYLGRFTLGLFILASLACSAARAETYSIGVVPQFESRRMFANWLPIVGELEKRSGLHFKLVVPLNVPEFERELEKGSFDFIYANPYHVMRINRQQNYIPLVRDKTPLRGILVLRKDSPIRDIRELNGKTLAMPSPNALGASLLMRADLEHLYGVRMNPMYVKTHSSVYLSVLNGLADAGGGVGKTFDEQDKPVRDALRVLYTTRDMPSHPLAAHGRVARADREKVQQALLDLAATPAGKVLLAEVPMKEPIPAAIEDYLVMRKWKLESYWVEEAK